MDKHINKKPYRDYGAVDFEDHEIDIIEQQTKKDMKEIDPLFMEEN